MAENSRAMTVWDKPARFVTDTGEVTLTLSQIKNFVARGSKDITFQEAVGFLQLCKFNRLNPFVGDAFLVKYGQDPATMVTSKYAFAKRLKRASEVEGFKAGIVVGGREEKEKLVYREGSLKLPGEELIGGWAEVYLKNWKFPVRVEVGFDEYVGTKKDGSVTAMWRNKPATMIRKVAYVQAIREALPDVFGGLYSQEEIPGAEDLTPPTGDGDGVIDVQPEDPKGASKNGARSTSEEKPSGREKKEAEPEEGNGKEDRSEDEPGPVIRRRRQETVANGQKVKTAGIEGKTLAAIQEYEDSGVDEGAAGKRIADFLEEVGVSDVTFLREDEGQELLQKLQEKAAGGLRKDEPEERSENSASSPPEQKSFPRGESMRGEEKAPEEEDDIPMFVYCPEAGSRKPVDVCRRKCDRKEKCYVYRAYVAGDEAAMLEVRNRQKGRLECPDRGDTSIEAGFCVDHCEKSNTGECPHWAVG